VARCARVLVTALDARQDSAAILVSLSGASIRFSLAELKGEQVDPGVLYSSPGRDLVDQQLCAENCCKGEALGIFGPGFGGEDHDPQVIGGDD
jgi:hypothetical protein